MSELRVAYIGCGAVVERSHLPALESTEGYRLSALVDLNQQQLSDLSARYPDVLISNDINSVLDNIDLVVIATPSASHYDLGQTALRAGKHVLMEKPLATSHNDASELLAMASSKNRVLGVSLVRRYLPHFKLFKSLLDAAVVGTVREFNVAEGGRFNWPVQSPAFYRSAQSGGGVLMDNGAHLLDACLWWFGDFDSVDYFDDSDGGVEAECSIQMIMQSGAKGSVSMSRLRSLDNSIRVLGDNGRLRMNLLTGEIELQHDDSDLSFVGSANHVQDGIVPSDTISLFATQYRAMLDVIAGEQSDLVQGHDCLASIRLIEQCYASRQRLESVQW